jgi:hypothetical protein
MPRFRLLLLLALRVPTVASVPERFLSGDGQGVAVWARDDHGVSG